MTKDRMIDVSYSRFKEIFKSDEYVTELIPSNGRMSYYESNVKDSKGNIVGYYTETSWESTYEVILELCSVEDISDYYLKRLNRAEYDLKRAQGYIKELKDYQKLSWWGKLKYKYHRWRKAQYRKKHPGLFEFLEEGSVYKYEPMTSESLSKLIIKYWND